MPIVESIASDPDRETLGVLAHRGGLLVQRPELSVGVVRAVSRPSGLELELLARRPLEGRVHERQAVIGAGHAGASVAPRRLLPPFDEGTDLRVGWLDTGGRAHWVFGDRSGTGNHADGLFGQSLRTRHEFPPLFDQVSVVLAWPEIGFPETVVDLALPDRVTVDRDSVSIWEAPLNVRIATVALNHRVGAHPTARSIVETGRIVAVPQVLSRGDATAVVLTRLTAVGRALSIEILSVAYGDRADAVREAAIPLFRQSPDPDDPESVRTGGPGAAIAVVRDRDAVWAWPVHGSCIAGRHTLRAISEFVVDGLDASGGLEGASLDLVVAWPAAGLPDVCVELVLSEG
jgi:hypothetical protein